jgi:hypothetical protein
LQQQLSGKDAALKAEVNSRKEREEQLFLKVGYCLGLQPGLPRTCICQPEGQDRHTSPHKIFSTPVSLYIQIARFNTGPCVDQYFMSCLFLSFVVLLF